MAKSENILACYKFKVTRTLQNGKERTETKCVYSHGFLEDTNNLIKAETLLKENHFYNIDLISCEYLKNGYFID